MSVVSSDGRIVEVHRPTSPFVPSSSLLFYDGVASDYATLYRSQPNVRTVVEFLGRNIAQLGLKVYRRVSDQERQELADHPLSQTLRRPQGPLGWTTRYRLIRDTIEDLATYGNAYWLKTRIDGGRIGLLREYPWLVSLLGENRFRPDAYRIGGSRGFIDLPREQVVHFRYYNPDDGRIGVSPLETLRRILAEEAAAGAYREYFWRNSARMDVVIKRPPVGPGVPAWSDAARNRFRADWESRYGGPENSGKAAILEEGMDIVQLNFNSRDSQYVETRKLTREECASAYHIPPPMVGILDNATFSNITEQHKMLYQDTLGPWLVQFEEEIELQLLPEYTDLEGVYVEFNIAEKLKGSFEEQAESLSRATGAPYMLRQEARARLNLPPVAGLEQPVIPLNVLEGGQSSPQDAGAARKRRGGAKALPRTSLNRRKRHIARHTKTLQEFFARQESAILRRLGEKSRFKQHTGDVFDASRWDRELRDDLVRLGLLTAGDFGDEVAAEFDADFDADDLLDWLDENARIAAENINAATASEVEKALASDDPAQAVKDLFAGLIAARAGQIAVTRVTTLANFGRLAAANSAGAGTKVWSVTSANPRPSHSAMDGEEVAIGELFSNGAKWPGDPSLPPEERAGCSCLLEFVREAPAVEVGAEA